MTNFIVYDAFYNKVLDRFLQSEVDTDLRKAVIETHVKNGCPVQHNPAFKGEFFVQFNNRMLAVYAYDERTLLIAGTIRRLYNVVKSRLSR